VATFVKAAVFCRYGILLLCGLPLIALYAAVSNSRLLGSVLLVDTRWELLTLSVLHFLAAGCGIAMMRTVLLNGTARFQDFAFNPSKTLGWPWLIAWFIFGALLPVLCVYFSRRDEILVWALVGDGLVIATSALVALFILAGAGFIARLVLGEGGTIAEVFPWQSRRWGSAATKSVRRPSRLAALLNMIGAKGYVAPMENEARGEVTASNYQIAPGHRELAALAFVVGVSYLVGYWLVGLVGPENAPLPVVAYAVVIFLFLGLLLGAFAFLLDYFRLPVPIVILIAYMFTRQVYLIDHFFEIKPPQKPFEPPTINEFLDGIGKPESHPIPEGRHGKTLVIINAAGGGIQANAWTVRVLTGLHERYGARFTHSVTVVSSVSGGSVGTLHYLANYDALVQAG
jgi:hypothetical protein